MTQIVNFTIILNVSTRGISRLILKNRKKIIIFVVLRYVKLIFMKSLHKYHPLVRNAKGLYTCQMATNGLKESVVDIAQFHDFLNEYPQPPVRCHTHDFYVILVFQHGNGRHTVDMEEFEVEGKEVFLLAPGMAHSYECACRSGFGIFFSEELFNYFTPSLKAYVKRELFSLTKGPIHFKVPSNRKDKIETLQNQLAEEYAKGRGDGYYLESMGILVSALILEILRYCIMIGPKETITHTSAYNHYQLFTKSVETNFKSLHSVKEYASRLKLSLSTLNRSVINAGHQKPLCIINQRLILEAKKMLCFSPQMSIKEIAAELGFKDASHFVRFFYRHTALTPTAFRKKAFGAF
ncbi:MAG: helix-turn-helix transcriptional regulator [Bacteroidales bacterium]|nr:helix-turn-helix transcriptional regulator [Bacteroidales bacterium]